MGWYQDRPRHRFSGWGISSYAILVAFVTGLLFMGVHDSSFVRGRTGKKPRVEFPDFESVTSLYKELPESEVNLHDKDSRFIFIGDVHGMNSSLHDLLTKLSWDPAHDTLFFAGDTLAKSTHATSLAVWDFIYANHVNAQGRQVIYPVRGNHDQMVVQWRAWREWFEGLTLPLPRCTSHCSSLSSLPFSLPSLPNLSSSLYNSDPGSTPPPIHTGRDFLNLVEAEWVLAASSPGTSPPPDPDEYVEVARKRARGTWREAWWARIPRAHGKREKKMWRMFTDHYWLARDMGREQARWMMREVPLVYWVAGVHAYVVHAGLLPADPRKRGDADGQPLARVPGMGSRDGEKERVPGYSETVGALPVPAQQPFGSGSARPTGSEVDPVNTTAQYDISALRRLQEEAILTQVSQNTDSWTVLNMRSVKKSGKVTRKGDKGTPWSELWGDAMGRCKGFGLPGEGEYEAGFGLDMEEEDMAPDGEMNGARKRGSKKYELKCYPSTVIYGHAATRGLDVKRWSVGIDTGCLYGRRLTALVLSRRDDNREDEDAEDDNEDEDEDSLFGGRRPHRVKFGDSDAHIKAKLVHVACPNIGVEG